DVFVLGTNMGLFHKWFQGGWGPSITDYEFMGGICTSQPEAVSWEPGRLDVFVTGTDRALYHKWFDGGWGPSLTDFEYMGGICRRASSVGGRAVSMCSSLARTAHCITSGLMATGGRPSPITNTSAATFRARRRSSAGVPDASIFSRSVWTRRCITNGSTAAGGHPSPIGRTWAARSTAMWKP